MILRRHSWPGNVREILHVLEQVMVLSEGDVLQPADLPASILEKSVTIFLGEGDGQPLPLREVERLHVLSVMERTVGNRAKAAQILGISERNLYRLIKRYAGQPEAEGDSDATSGA